ncbi:MAG: rhomboid family intramembrane serine protease [archaeon]
MIKKQGRSLTFSLIIANVAVFAIWLFLLLFKLDISRYLAVVPNAILQGKDIWTIITSVFMHASVGHLLMNMMSLAFLGNFLERILGRKRFFIFYMLAGIFASLFFVFFAFLFKQDLNIGAVGASGAIFGIAGLIAILTPQLPVYIMFIPIAMPMWIASFVILIVMWLLSLVAGLPIGNSAHLGGLITGMAYGFYLKKRYPRKVMLLNKYLMGRH